MNTEKNTTTKLKEEQLDKVQGGGIILGVLGIITGIGLIANGIYQGSKLIEEEAREKKKGR